MSLSLVILTVCILLFGLRGYFKGFFVSLGRVIAVITGYLALVYGLAPSVALIETKLGLDGTLVYLLAGLILFAGAGMLVGLLFAGLEKLLLKDAKSSTGSRVGGLLIGASLGAICGLMIIYCISLVQEVRDLKAANQTAQMTNQFESDTLQQPEAQQSLLETSARKLLGSATGQIVKLASPEAAPLTAAFVESPTTMVRNLQTVSGDVNLRSLLQDKDFHQLLNSGNLDAIQRDPRFKAVAKMPEMRQLLKHAGVEQEASEQQLAAWAANSWQRAEQIRNQQEVQAILNDPAFQKKLDSGDKLSLMTDPKFKTLLDQFFSTAPSKE